MIIIRNNIIPFGRDYGAINLFGILFVKPDMPLTAEVINHERIHTAQMRALLYVPFYIIYIIEWLIRLLQQKNLFRAYMAISFEREAYANSNNLGYLNHRKRFAQWRA